MKKAAIIGHFAFGREFLDGQTVKTKIITEELKKQLGEEQILRIDTYGGAKTLFKAPLQVLNALRKAENVLIFPAHNGLRVYAPLLALLRRLFKNRKVHYVVIGGWLPEFLKGRNLLEKALKEFDGIYVETTNMQKALVNQGFKNIEVMPNCKNLNILKENELVYPSGEPYKLCTFSRINAKKGIEDAVSAVKNVNEKYGKTVFTLDIYGKIDGGQIEWFENLKVSSPEYIKYGGAVAFDKSTGVLKNYFALLFPTHYYTEGIPGTIIDAYAAGIPVISAKWENYADIIDENITGKVYEFDNYNAFEKILMDVAENPESLNDLKTNCIKKAKNYLPEEVVITLLNNLC